MAQVPYQPFATAQPLEQGRGPRDIGVATPPAAFGENIAETVKGLGGSIERDGNELWNRAVALQELKNETEAKDADIKFMSTAGDIHAKFNALEGQDRVNAFPKYKQDLMNLYQQHRGGLSNDMARRMFDSSAVSTLSRTIFNGAGVTASAQKEWTLSSIKAEHDMLVKQVFTSPTDEGGFSDAMGRIPKMARDMATFSPGGWSQEREDDLRMNMESALIKNKIEGIARAAPLKAREEYEKNAAKMTEPDRRATESAVTTGARIQGSDILGNEVINKYRQPDGTYSKSAKDMEEEVRTRAEELYKFDPLAGTHAVEAFKHLYQERYWADEKDIRDVQNQVKSQIYNGAKSLDQFPPELLQRMTDPMKLAAKGAIFNHIASERRADNANEEYRLRGLYANKDTRPQFLDEDIIGNKLLSRSQIGFFMKLQRDPIGDTRVDNAMKLLRGARGSALQTLGVFSRDKGNPTEYDRFTGALHEALQGFQETYGKKPTEKEILEQIYPTVIKTIKTPGWLWGTSDVPIFKADVPEPAKRSIEKDYEEEGRKPPTEDDYVREFERAQFMEYFAGQKKAATSKKVPTTSFRRPNE